MSQPSDCIKNLSLKIEILIQGNSGNTNTSGNSANPFASLGGLGGLGGGSGGINADMMRGTMDMLRQNPELMRSMLNTMNPQLANNPRMQEVTFQKIDKYLWFF